MAREQTDRDRHNEGKRRCEQHDQMINTAGGQVGTAAGTREGLVEVGEDTHADTIPPSALAVKSDVKRLTCREWVRGGFCGAWLGDFINVRGKIRCRKGHLNVVNVAA